jgi:TRAP-type uncharacterized transport system fused permease subunit
MLVETNPRTLNMPIWLPTVAATVVAVSVTAFLQFYFRFVPEVTDEQRHLRKVGWWLWDILTVVGPCWSLYELTQINGPITPTRVVTAALCAASLAFCMALTLTRRTVGRLLERHIEIFGLSINIQKRMIDASQVHRDALWLLANDANLSPELAAKLKTLLRIDDQMAGAKQLGD